MSAGCQIAMPDRPVQAICIRENQTLRKTLNAIYFAGGLLAALCLLLIAGIILAQIAGRFFDFVVPSANKLAGFLMAGVIFLALPYSFRAGSHIRVELALNMLGKYAQRRVNLVCLVVAIGVTAFMTWNFMHMLIKSWQYGDMSDGLLGVPLWLPQSAFVIGLASFLIALVDETVTLLTGKHTAFETASAETLQGE